MDGADLDCTIVLRGDWVTQEICVDLTDANLGHASLRGTKLLKANLKGVNLEGADLRGADLSSVKNWREIVNMSVANVFGVLNAPDGFIEWAIREMGAVSIESDEEWITKRQNTPPSDRLYRYKKEQP